MAKRRKVNIPHLLIVIAVFLAIVFCAVKLISLLFRKPAETGKTEQPTQQPEEPDSEAGNQPSATASSVAVGEDGNIYVNNDPLLIIANKSHALAENYAPEDLETAMDCSSGACLMRQEAAEALQEMVGAASQDGVTLLLNSAYRSEEYQAQLYSYYVSIYGTDEADSISSRPGYSDHQTGLAADFASYTNSDADFTESFGDTVEGQWLYENAWKYGFVIRYPKGKDSITGYTYEGWHYRYVGKENAEKIYSVSPDETIEEYYNVQGGTEYPQ